MKKIFRLFLLICTFSLPCLTGPTQLSALAQPGTLVAPDIKAILDRGFLVVGMHAVDQPPFFMVDPETKDLIGHSVDIAKQIASGLGVQVQFDRTAQSFDEVVGLVAAGKVDLGMSKLSFTLGRAKSVLYNVTHTTLSKSLMINRLERAKLEKKQNKPHTLRKLFSSKNARIGVVANSSYVSFAKKLFPNATVIEHTTWEEVIDALLKGEVTAVLRDNIEMIKIMKQKPDLNLVLQHVDIKNDEDSIHSIVHHRKFFLNKWIDQFIKRNYLRPQTAQGLMNKFDAYFEKTGDK